MGFIGRFIAILLCGLGGGLITGGIAAFGIFIAWVIGVPQEHWHKVMLGWMVFVILVLVGIRAYIEGKK